MTTQDPELSAALGWPGGISDPVLDRKVLLQMVAAMRLASQQALEALKGDQDCMVETAEKHWEYKTDLAITALRAALAQQDEPVEPVQDQRCRAEPRSDGDFVCDCKIGECPGRSAALAQQAEPVAGKVVAWGVFANIDGEWQLQHPVFAGDEQGKVNAEFERASYSGPQPLEVRPLGVVTATAQQAEPVQEPVAWSGYDLDGMVEAFSRVIEAHYQRANPFQHPIDMDAQMALRVLRGFIPAMKAYAAIKAVEEGK